jgi:hypothetical protein
MSKVTRENFYLNRRSGVRVDFRSSIRFQPDPSRRFRLAQAVTQNLSLRGMQVLSPTIFDQKKKFEVWIPLEGVMVVPAMAKTEWMSVEDTFGDSAYWIVGGLSLTFRNDEERRLYAETILKHANLDRVRKEQETSKVGFVF